jgi:hypothetical protein
MFLFETLGPIKRTVPIKMLDRCLITWAASCTDVFLKWESTVRAHLEFPSESQLYPLWNLESVCHIHRRDSSFRAEADHALCGACRPRPRLPRISRPFSNTADRLLSLSALTPLIRLSARRMSNALDVGLYVRCQLSCSLDRLRLRPLNRTGSLGALAAYCVIALWRSSFNINVSLAHSPILLCFQSTLSQHLGSSRRSTA